MSLRRAYAYYTILIIGAYLTYHLIGFLDDKWLHLTALKGIALFLGLYLTFGVIAYKAIISHLIEFNPLYKTIDNETAIRLNSIIFWPLSTLLLLLKLTIIVFL